MLCTNGKVVFSGLRTSVMRLYCGFIALMILAAVAPQAAAIAQTQQQIEWCEGKGGATSDLVIGGCTAVIQSGKYTGKNLSMAFRNRGKAYGAKREYDHAIEDEGQAIKLDPKNVSAFNDRGMAYYNKEDYDRAIADYNQAIQLDPKHASAFNNRGNAYNAKHD
jgi:tetratricopeptide (TPR) repeat protein